MSFYSVHFQANWIEKLKISHKNTSWSWFHGIFCMLHSKTFGHVTVPNELKSLGFPWKRTVTLIKTSIDPDLSDQDLNRFVAQIKKKISSAGYWMVKSRLQSIVIHIQWRRVAASVHKVVSTGVLSRMFGLVCVVRCKNSVRGLLSLWHVDTNHKLIKFYHFPLLCTPNEYFL